MSQIKTMSQTEQLETICDLVKKVSNPMTRSYGVKLLVKQSGKT
ncbi:MAG: orange carotenoid protein N-terminal domain-containing protein, partial [Microcystis aeruginosa]